MTIEKRIPVAAGLGGGSADAAAVLRAANELAGRPARRRRPARARRGLGADVPSQIEPRHALVTGAGEGVEPVELPPMTLLLVPDATGLSTAEVYAQADALGTTRDRARPRSRARRSRRGRCQELAAALENDLEAAAAVAAARAERAHGRAARGGRSAARVTGSGPTVFGVFRSGEAPEVEGAIRAELA